MEDKVSIIVPIYNVEAYLKRCIDSLLSQTYPNIEILLIDDCSTDGSAKIAKEYAELYPKVCRFVQRDKNGGLSAARNTGIKRSTGEWLSFVDSDDWVNEEYISSMYDIAQKEGADIVANESRYIYFSAKETKMDDPTLDIKSESLQKEKVARLRFGATSHLIRKSFFLKTSILFPEDIWRCEDICTMVPLYTYTDKISILHKPLYYYFQRKGSLSNTNHHFVDVSFYLKTIHRMIDLSSAGYEQELEFRAIAELMYGMVMIMIRSGRSKGEVYRHIDWFESKFPSWKENPYFSTLPKGKQIFIDCASRKMYIMLKVLIWCWDLVLLIKRQKVLR